MGVIEEFRSCVAGADSYEDYKSCGWRYLPRSYRNYDPMMYRDAFASCSDLSDEDCFQCESAVRGKYRDFESGRWWDVGKDLHRMVCSLDVDEVNSFVEDHPDMVDLINEWAEIEGMRKIKRFE